MYASSSRNSSEKTLSDNVMYCHKTTAEGDVDFIGKLREKFRDLRVPLSGSIELTHRCNLNCIHCYLRGGLRDSHARSMEMSTTRVLSLIDEITSAGCLFLLITGGEPLLRGDFADIYRQAKKNGLVVNLFTNGTLIDEEILDLFEELPPRVVDISLYGATPDTADKITGVPGSYRKCIQSVRKLLDRGVCVQLKTILMTCNRHELEAMEKMAGDLGVKFRFDAAIYPRHNGDRSPLDLRVPPEEAVGHELGNAVRLGNWKELYQNSGSLPPSDKLYSCGAGLNSFHIDPYGNLQPCLMSTGHRYNLGAGCFLDGWNGEINRVRKIMVRESQACYKCSKRILCGFCPPFCELENGAGDGGSPYLCAMGDLRLKAIRGQG